MDDSSGNKIRLIKVCSGKLIGSFDQFDFSPLRTPPCSDIAERLGLTKYLGHCTPGGYVNIFDIHEMLAQAIHKVLEVTVCSIVWVS